MHLLPKHYDCSDEVLFFKDDMIDNINEKDVYTEYEASKLISKSSLFVAISLWIVDIIFLLLVCSFILKSTPKKTSYMRIRNSKNIKR